MADPPTRHAALPPTSAFPPLVAAETAPALCRYPAPPQALQAEAPEAHCGLLRPPAALLPDSVSKFPFPLLSPARLKGDPPESAAVARGCGGSLPNSVPGRGW